MATRLWAGALVALVLLTVGFVGTPDAYAGDVSVRVTKKGDLVISGARRQRVALWIEPAGEGLTVIPVPPNQSDGVDQTVNGGSEPFTTTGAVRDLKIRVPAARGSELAIRSDDVGTMPRFRNLKVNLGNATSQFRMSDVTLDGDLKFRRPSQRTGTSLRIDDTTVAGAFSALIGADTTFYVDLTGLTVLGPARIATRVRRRVGNLEPEFIVIGCDFSTLSVNHPHVRGDTRLAQVSVTGDCLLRGDLGVGAFECTFGGDLTMKASLRDQRTFMTACTVAGRLTVVSGLKNDRLDMTDCQVGSLTFRGGPGNDRFVTTRVTSTGTSRFIGSEGNGDTWVKSPDDLPDLILSGVEQTEQQEP